MNRQITAYTNVLYNVPNKLISQYSYINEFADSKAIDTLAGGSAFILGYNNEEIIDYVATEFKTISRPQIIVNHTSDKVEFINDFLCNTAKMSNIVWANSGTGAVEAAINIARNYMKSYGKDIILSITPSWHGTSRLCQELSGITEKTDPYVINITAKRWETVKDREDYETEILSKIIKQLNNSDNIAGIIFDPVPWISGSLEYSHSWWLKIRELCTKHNVLMIVDDVALCYGKCKNWFSHLNHGIIPDIVAAGKALTSGYAPVGIAMCTNKVYQGLDKLNFTYSHTLQPYAGAVYAAIKTSEIILRDNLLERAVQIEHRLQNLGEYFKTSNKIKHYRVSGLFMSFDLHNSIQLLTRYGLTGRYYAGTKLNMCAPLIADSNYYDQLAIRIDKLLNT